MRKYFTVLTILGFLFLSAGAFAQQPPAKPEKPAKPAPAQQGPQANMKDFLQLTTEQEAKLKDMRKAGQEEQKAFRGQMQKLRGELAPLLKDPKADQNKINGLVDQIAKLGADRTKKVLANRNPLQKILTPEQLEKLKNAPPRMMGRGGMMGGMRGMGPGMGQGQMGGMRGMDQMGQGRMMMRPGMGRGMGMGGGMAFMGPQGMRGRAMRIRTLLRGWLHRRGFGRWFQWQE
jgi:Spy/CpxP family protein refolding chaperone